jgi:hypothetical protein
MANTTNYNWETPDDTDLVKDGAAAIRTLGSSVDTTTKNLNPQTTTGALAYRSATANVNTALPIGTANQVLRVNSGGTAPEWATTADQTPLTTKGDLFGFDTADARIPIGTNGHILTADSTQSLGLKWAAPAGGGKVLQVITDTDSTEILNSTATYADTNLSVTITPSSASSKIMVFVYDTCQRNQFANAGVNYRLVRASTTIVQLQNIMFSDDASYHQGMIGIAYLDSPSTTSATTYKTTFASNGTGSAQVHMQNNITAITVMEIGA